MKWIKGKQQRKVMNTNQIYDKGFVSSVYKGQSVAI